MHFRVLSIRLGGISLRKIGVFDHWDRLLFACILWNSVSKVLKLIFLLKQLLETCSKYNLDRGAVDPSDRGPRGWNNPHIDLVARMLTQIVNTHLYFINL